MIAVTGSAGKTTTKEMIASILERKWKVYKTKDNMNLPAYIDKQSKEISSKHRAVVLEYGMSKAGHIRKSCQLIKPNIGVVTMVGAAHIGNFGGSIRRVAQAKSELIRGMNQSGMLFLNADDRNSRYLTTKDFRGKVFTVSLYQKAEYRASRIAFTETGMSFSVEINRKLIRFHIPAFGKHNIYNALFAIGVARQLGISVDTIRKGLENYQKPDRRLVVYRLRKDVKVIDDTFSANPQAAQAAVDVLAQIGKGKRIFVLGDMLELGRYSEKGHQIVGAYAARNKVHHLLTYGRASRHARNAAVSSGLSSVQARHFNDRRALHAALYRLTTPSTTILVKGSHKMRMNQTVKYISNEVGSRNRTDTRRRAERKNEAGKKR
ncbi:UDP-N-acetylmuramoyl-tripeptide--D-alanyl-D-alanine ligase [Paenibacillus lautus]|uniref:UDP-N-acetylmuramoyl-tripeptide--D-alanyl-D- alanine ligase n=1 Tax=Paenibacillus lautus TaxID=1401 RepID=UPI002DB87796|nr:UDP-N-acetylmuramoyl-tripeptide--D-alanyl-D-alanine ligase [Paenibacillus lautus]MEC0256815.1 UDP-N-acetylmuramoyl-tripeptide--D-alanyl-D-alanine ligase [Paenibacillus lautus]